VRDDFPFGEFFGDAHGAFDCFGFGAAVADDETAIDAEERRAAVFVVIQFLFEAAQGREYQERGRFCEEAGVSDRVFDELQDGDGGSELALDVTPIVSVSALEIDGQPVDLSEIAIYATFIAFKGDGDWNARLRSYSRVFPEGRKNVKVSYRAGYARVPADISDACRIQVAYLMNTLNKQGIESETNSVAQSATTFSKDQLAMPVRLACNRGYRRTRVSAI
jgi:hypothetical protein